MLGRIAASYEARPAQRDDLLQEIALALWRALPTWRGEASLKTFVARIASNCGVDHVMSARRHEHAAEVPEELPDPHANPEHEADLQQRQAHLMAAVRQLPLNLRQVVMLALEGFAHAQIADTLGISTNNVDVRLSRARQLLRRQLEEPA